LYRVFSAAHAFFLTGWVVETRDFLVPVQLARNFMPWSEVSDVTPELTNAEDSDKFVVSLEAASDDPY